jgi:hypothetical protein
MSDTYLHVRDEPVKNIMDGLQFLYPVVHEEQLTSAMKFILYYLLHLVMIEQHDLRLHRNSVRRRSIDDGKVSRSKKRELKGTWNRCGS